MIKSIFLFLFLGICSLNTLTAQELKCEIQINSAQLENIDRVLIENMRQAIFEFVNGRRWTNDKFKDHERIECSMLINLKSINDNSNFSGEIQIQSRRPVYGSAYNTTIFSFRDENVTFTYNQYAVLEYSETSYLSNLTALLAFYSYMIIGYDYDSFSLNGGTPYFQKAQQIVGFSETSGAAGWSSTEKNQRNRYWLVENHLQPRFVNLRKCFYEYHRLGLDQMSNNKEDGRKKLLAALQLLDEVHRNVPNSFNIRVFFDSKSTEVIKIFKDAEREEKDNLMQTLTKVDPANALKYQQIY
jgi:hypothetical protein